MKREDVLPTGVPVVDIPPRLGQIEPARRLGVGVIGLHEGHSLLMALNQTGWCRAVAGCDLKEGTFAEARDAQPGLFCTTFYDEMLARDDVHIVAIYTPDHLHAEQIRRAFEAGKHVICTKPLINDLAHGAALLKAAAASGRRLQVGQSTRFFEPFQRQRADFERGAVGAVEVVDAHYNHRMDWFYHKSPWSLTDTDWAFAGLSHPLDLIRWYLGGIDEVHAYGTTTALGREFGLKTFDAYVVNLRAADGRIGRVLGNYGITELPRARCHIECLLMGERGTSLAKYPALEYVHAGADGAEVHEDFHQAMSGYYFRHQLKGMHYGEFANYADHFARAIINDEPNDPGLAEGLETVCVMEAVRTSARTGKPIALGPLLERAGLRG